MENKYIIITGAVAGTLVGGLWYLLNNNKNSQKNSDLSDLTAERLMDEFEPVSESFDQYKGIKHYSEMESN